MLSSQSALRVKYQTLQRGLDERSLRLCAAADAKMLGYGGVSLVARASGLSRTTIHAGQSESVGGGMLIEPKQGVRREGGGRKALTQKQPKLLEDLDRLLDPSTRGDPMSPLRWTCKSTPKLAEELRARGHRVSQTTVWRLLEELGYSMQSNRKSREGSDHPDRNAQFEFINESVKDFLARSLPVISVDTEKKELVGRFKNGGREWEKKGEPVEVNVHDFPDKELGKAIPYGIYDVGRNEGWVSVGITHDTAEFAAESVRRWWRWMGCYSYGQAKELLLTSDGGGSNGTRVRLWKVVLRQLASDLGLEIHVRHLPPGTSKWNKIEHRMFSHITENWRGRPLMDYVTVVNSISNTRTKTGLHIRAELDDSKYETGKIVSEEEMATLPIFRCDFHGEWNYSFKP
jgi:transposase